MSSEQQKDFMHKRIAALVKRSGTKQTILSQLIGKSPTYFSDIIAGKKLMSFKSFFDLCEYFEITPAEFFDETVNDPTQAKQLVAESQRLCGDHLDEFIQLLAIMEPEEMETLLGLAAKIGRKSKKSKNKEA